MAPKKKSKKITKSKKTTGKKIAPKKNAGAKMLAKKNASAKKPTTKKPIQKLAHESRKRIRGQNQDVETVVYSPAGVGPGSAGQSGSLQGLSDIETANSESVDELIEEGNAFEAEAVKGVEDAPDPDESEVHTHEVPEDDVPREYDDQ